MTWYSDDCARDVHEKGFVVGLACLQTEFLVQGWWYSIWIVETDIGSNLYPTLNDWTPEDELTPWEV